MKNALIIASVASMIDQFNRNNISILQDMGYKVFVACNFESPGTISSEKANLLKDELKKNNVTFFQIDFSRSATDIPSHIKSFHQIKQIINSTNFSLIHCHAPICGILTRLAANSQRKHQNLKMIYTAHGFHFYKGAPITNWILYYPIEKFCGRFTDILITINQEDFSFANRNIRANQIEYVPGVGIDVDKFSRAEIDREEKRQSLGVPTNAKVILSIGELNKNKNHQSVIKALGNIHDSNIHYVIAGIGNEKENLEELAHHLNVNLHLLGYRNDVTELYKTADLYVLPSLREGLNVSLMEAMASGCPVIASKIRGNTDMIPLSNCFKPNDIVEISRLLTSDIIADYPFVGQIRNDKISERMREIYCE